MAIYLLKVWVGDEPRTLAYDELIEADDDAKAIESAKAFPIGLGLGLPTKVELRNNLSFVVWSLPSYA